MSLRSRGVSPQTVTRFDYTNLTNGGHVGGLQSTCRFPDGTFERISDENPQRSRYGNCYHQKRQGAMRHDSIIIFDGTYQNRISDRSHYLSYVVVEPSWPSYDLNQLNAEAYLTMKPSLQSGFSLTNFILELRDFKSMFSIWDRRRSILQNAASGHLNWSFGWSPFIADCQEIWSKLWNMKETLENYKSKQGIQLVRHFKKKLWSDLLIERSYRAGSSTVYCRCRGNCIYNATMRYTYTVPKIDSEYAKILGVMDILGLNFGPSVVWEALPFSFVVDWFLSVGNVLSAYETDYLESRVQILDFCHSVKQNFTTTVSIVDAASEHGLYSETVSVYNRQRCLPNATDFGLQLAHRYGTKQIVLSGALLLS